MPVKLKDLSFEERFDIASERLREVGKFILNNPHALNMHQGLVSNCGTTGCIAGWVAHHYTPPGEIESVITYRGPYEYLEENTDRFFGGSKISIWSSVEGAAVRLLGFKYKFAEPGVFYLRRWPVGLQQQYYAGETKVSDALCHIQGQLVNDAVFQSMDEAVAAVRAGYLVMAQAVCKAIESYIENELEGYMEITDGFRLDEDAGEGVVIESHSAKVEPSKVVVPDVDWLKQKDARKECETL